MWKMDLPTLATKILLYVNVAEHSKTDIYDLSCCVSMGAMCKRLDSNMICHSLLRPFMDLVFRCLIPPIQNRPNENVYIY